MPTLNPTSLPTAALTVVETAREAAPRRAVPRRAGARRRPKEAEMAAIVCVVGVDAVKSGEPMMTLLFSRHFFHKQNERRSCKLAKPIERE